MAKEFKNEWRHLGENAMATNAHETMGGIIDQNLPTGTWFIIFNDDRFPIVEGLSSKAEAFEIFEKVISE